ncbi:MAG: hypothetical protein M1436_08770 [Acidobacteria bacterium]|nr:hypothetical protein [Acidobacteriota bacterium]
MTAANPELRVTVAPSEAGRADEPEQWGHPSAVSGSGCPQEGHGFVSGPGSVACFWPHREQ